MRYWVGVVSKNHVQRGVEGGFAQLCHGKKSALQKMDQGDILIYYSPKIDMKGDEKYQKFTAIGQVLSSEPYQVQMTPTFHPYRLDVHYFDSHDCEIKPLLNLLNFSKGKKSWGYVLRFGIFEISKEDFLEISKGMQANLSSLTQ